MPDLLSGILTFALLVGALSFMVRGSRPRPGKPARTWKDLGEYRLEGQMWAVALLTGMALGEIINAVGAGVQPYSLLAFGLGVWCGSFVAPTTSATVFPGAVGALASVIGSVAFVADGADSAERVMRGALVLAIGLLFALFIAARVKPLGGLMWFAALDVVAFAAGPAGASWAQAGGVSIGVFVLASIGIAVSFAFVPEFLIGLAAFGVVAVQVIGTGTGYLPGSFLHSITPIILTMAGYFLTRWARRRLRVGV